MSFKFIIKPFLIQLRVYPYFFIYQLHGQIIMLLLPTPHLVTKEEK